MGVVVLRFGLCVGLLGVLCAEPSAFDLQSGATKQELNTLKSSNRNLENILTTLQSQADALSQHQDGLNNLFKGQAAKLHDFSTTLDSHDQALKSLKATQDMQADMLKSQASLLETLKTQIQTNKNALQQLDQKNCRYQPAHHADEYRLCQ
ncbi:TPR repeat containing exported protein; Putative periplasmic protein contains a protein prenylyltransferase domain [Helicobacter bizzozeronii CCUG 35545]|nr:TPR repeat containing exported protein; Putative periplasmic protein contains a protein prenylyltransferase domain [Helicobacter bizzozeronii CCUG 35545]